MRQEINSEITLTGSGTKYEIPIVSGLACAITEPGKYGKWIWIVPTKQEDYFYRFERRSRC